MSLEAIEGKEVDELTEQARELLEVVDMDHIADRLEGRDGGLRPSKPTANGDSGLEQYVWRMARFHSGQDPKMPVTASWWLQDFLESEGIDAEVSGIMDDSGKEITGILEIVARVAVHRLNGDPDAGLKRWKKAIHG